MAGEEKDVPVEVAGVNVVVTVDAFEDRIVADNVIEVDEIEVDVVVVSEVLEIVVD